MTAEPAGVRPIPNGIVFDVCAAPEKAAIASNAYPKGVATFGKL